MRGTLVLALLALGLVLPAGAEATSPYEAAIQISKRIGSRPSASANEARAHRYVGREFGDAGLQVSVDPFRVPGRGRSRNVIGVLDSPARCLEILMAHTDSVPPGLGADDNASGVGVLVGLAPGLAALKPDCDVWLVATGSEERVVIGTGYHVGAANLVKYVKSADRAQDLRYALSVDMVGRGRRFTLRSPQPTTRPAVEDQMLAAANRAGVVLRWGRDSGQGNSDHREFELAGLPGAVIEVWRGIDPCHHEACDRPGRLQKPALNRVLRIAEQLVKGS
jgi:hypothetical protein